MTAKYTNPKSEMTRADETAVMMMMMMMMMMTMMMMMMMVMEVDEDVQPLTFWFPKLFELATRLFVCRWQFCRC